MAIISMTPDLRELARDLRKEGQECRGLLGKLAPGLQGEPQDEPEIVFDDSVIRVHYQGRKARFSRKDLQGLVRRLLGAGKCGLAYSIALLHGLDMEEEIVWKARELAENRDEMAMMALGAFERARGIWAESGGSNEAAWRKALPEQIARERRALGDSPLRKEYDAAIDDRESASVDGKRLGEYRETNGNKEIVLYLAAILPANMMNSLPWQDRINTPEGREKVYSVFAHEYFHFLHHAYAASPEAGGEIVRESLATYFQWLYDGAVRHHPEDLVTYCGIHDPYVYPYSGALQLEEGAASGKRWTTKDCKPRLVGEVFFREVFLESVEEEEARGSAERLLLHRLDAERSCEAPRGSNKGNGGILFENWLNDFRAYLIRDGKKPRTASSYLSYVRAAMLAPGNGTIGQSPSARRLLALARNAIQDTEREISLTQDFGRFRSLQSRLSALRSFLDWLSRQ